MEIEKREKIIAVAHGAAQNYCAPKLNLLGTAADMTQGGGISGSPDIAHVIAGSGAG